LGLKKYFSELTLTVILLTSLYQIPVVIGMSHWSLVHDGLFGIFVCLFVCFWQYWGLNSGGQTSLAGDLPFKPLFQSCLHFGYFR
jgi:hypothetical protein